MWRQRDALSHEEMLKIDLFDFDDYFLNVVCTRVSVWIWACSALGLHISEKLLLSFIGLSLCFKTKFHLTQKSHYFIISLNCRILPHILVVQQVLFFHLKAIAVLARSFCCRGRGK